MYKVIKGTAVSALVVALAACTTGGDIKVAEPKYKADVPANLLTADSVDTKYAGELTFYDGFPTDETIEKSYDFLDTSRAVQLFHSGMATASMYGMLNGHVEIGMKPNKSIGITEQMMNARSLWLTPQTTTPYATTEIDVKNGPVVVEVGVPIIGIMDDAYFKYVGDVGLGNANDRGKGGKYLVVGSDYKGDIPKGYIVLKTNTYRHWLIMRLLPKPGEVEQAVASFKETLKIYPLSEADRRTFAVASPVRLCADKLGPGFASGKIRSGIKS